MDEDEEDEDDDEDEEFGSSKKSEEIPDDPVLRKNYHVQLHIICQYS